MASRMEGKTDEARGRVKQAAGDLADEPAWKREGRLDRLAGRVKEKLSELVDRARSGLQRRG